MRLRPRADDDEEVRETEDAMLAALVRLHRRNQERGRPAAGGAPYQRILDHFDRRAQRLRGERVVTAELMERLFDGARGLGKGGAQQELIITGPPGGRAAGRLRVRNHSGRRARFDLVVGEAVVGAAIEGGAAPAIRFEDGGGELDPGQARLLRVEADLAAMPAGGRVVVPVECRWDCGWDRLWLVVIVDGEEGAGP
jgi:hypothetical protein